MRMHRQAISLYRHRVILAAFCVLLPVAAAVSENGTAPVVRGDIAGTAARITFDWPEAAQFTASMHNNALTVVFDRKANPDFRAVLKALYPYVTGAERKSDGKTLVFTLDKTYTVRRIDDGIELLHIDPKARPDLARNIVKNMATLEPAAGEEAAPAVAAVPEPAPVPVEAPAAEAVPTPLVNMTGVVPEVAPAPEPAAEAVAEAPAAPPAAEEATPAAPVAAPVADMGDTHPLSPELAQKLPPVAMDHVKVSVSAASDNAVLRLPFSERTALAVFVRHRTLWIAWHKPLPPDLSDFDDMKRTVIGKAEIIPAQGATVIRMPIEDAVFVGVAKEENSFDWAVLITPKKRDLAKTLPVRVNTDPPTPPHVFLPTLETSNPVTVTDPQAGDQLIITPFYSVGEGMMWARDFVEFSLLPTAQGLAVAKKSEDVAVLPLRNGLRISPPQGATLTVGLPDVDQSKLAGAMGQSVTLFPYEYWKPEDDLKMPEQKRALFHRIVESSNPQESNDARLRLAQLMLSQGLAAEALGYLDGINRTNPAFFRSSKLAALRGAANFLMYRFVESSRDFAAAELNNSKEVDYWRSMIGDLLGNPDQSYDYLTLNTDYISKYPPIFRQRLAIVAADRSIGGKDYNTALKIFDTLTQDKIIDPISTYVNFLMAKISSETGQDKEAKDTWDKLAEDYKHPFVQARAEFSRILWEIDHENLPKDKVIDRLERLRLAWHGDSLELNILTMLGDLYADQKDYVNAMRVWNGGVTAFPNTSASLDMSRKMQETFIAMFNGGVADQLPPLTALSLYYEYRNYTPTGNTGNEIINKLADRLVSVDLLEQAAALLDRQMHFAAEKEKRSEIGAKLATVYLFNHQPAKALATLQDSVYGENSLMLRLLRNRLTAEAMVELGQLDRALLTIGSDNSADAERIRIGVYWKNKNWSQLITSIENMLKTRKDITAPVTLEESEYLLKLALAYVFENNRTQLQYLHDYFTPLMAGNPNMPVFTFITGGDIQLTTTNFDDVIKNMADTRSFIENYHAHIQAAGLSSIVK